MKKSFLFVSLLMIAFCFIGCGKTNQREEKPQADSVKCDVVVVPVSEVVMVEESNIAKKPSVLYPGGVLPGVFSVSNNRKIQFSSGNLQYERYEDGSWKFAENQCYTYSFLNENPREHCDLFGWGSSGYKYTAYLHSAEDTLYGDGSKDIAGTNFDWGIYNKISGCEQDTWRTLTKDEWLYIIRKRKNATRLCGRANVSCEELGGEYCSASGIILLPDNWERPEGIAFRSIEDMQYPWDNRCAGVSEYYSLPLKEPDEDEDINYYSAEEWKIMESNGAVFLPETGRLRYWNYRSGPRYYYDQGGGTYWSSTADGSERAFAFEFTSTYIGYYSESRSYGYAVRLVLDYQNIADNQ